MGLQGVIVGLPTGSRFHACGSRGSLLVGFALVAAVQGGLIWLAEPFGVHTGSLVPCQSGVTTPAP